LKIPLVDLKHIFIEMEWWWWWSIWCRFASFQKVEESSLCFKVITCLLYSGQPSQHEVWWSTWKLFTLTLSWMTWR
jgi:hypothetical protein